MPISDNEMREPRFIKDRERYPMSYNIRDKYLTTVYPTMNVLRHSGEGSIGWKQAGYNPNHQSIRTERINLTSENLTLKPY